MTRFAGFRSPNRDIVASLCLWMLTFLNVVWGFSDLDHRYHALFQTQEARMECEARGGSYGAKHGGKDHCVERRAEVTR